MSLMPPIQPQFAEYRRHVDELVSTAILAADADAAVSRYLARDGRTLIVGREPDVERIDLDQGRVFLVAAGKAAVPMTRAAVRVLGDDLARGVVIGKEEIGNTAAALADARISFFAGGHPVPDERSVAGTKTALEMLNGLRREDAVLCLRI